MQADFDLQQFFEGRYYYSHFSDEGNVERLNDLPKQVHDKAGIKCQDSWPQGFGAIRIELSEFIYIKRIRMLIYITIE